MANGPSPIVPFLILLALLSAIPAPFDADEKHTTPLAEILPLFFLLMALLISQSVEIAVALTLVVYLLSSTFLMLLALVLITCFGRFILEEDGHEGPGSWKSGLGRTLLCSGFVILYRVLHEEEGYKSGVLVMMLTFFVLFSLF